MKTDTFEEAVRSLSLEPMEVRLVHGDVHWMVCRHPEERRMVVYDGDGAAWVSVVLPAGEFPDTGEMPIGKHIIFHEEVVQVGWITCERRPEWDLTFS